MQQKKIMNAYNQNKIVKPLIKMANLIINRRKDLTDGNVYYLLRKAPEVTWREISQERLPIINIYY